jgi:tetratricopeptide (TPR) repeat protein
VQPLDPLEARAQLADLHLHSPDYQAAAIKEFEAILAENPNLADAQRGLGYAYLRQQNFPRLPSIFRPRRS